MTSRTRTKPTVIITAGATAEPIDPVRLITNRSSGKMGMALLRESLRRGYPTILVHGLLSVPLPQGRYRAIEATTARDMLRTLLRLRPGNKILIMAAAVSDFRPSRARTGKIKRTPRGLTLRLLPNPDILATLSRRHPPLVTVGFAAETGRLISRGRAKFIRKGLDLLLANEVGRPGSGFSADRSRAVLLAKDRPPRNLGILPKREIAGILFDELERLIPVSPAPSRGTRTV